MSACAPASDGPLVGPRVEADVVGVCIPAGAGTQVFFGEVLTNIGEAPVMVTSVTSEHENVGSVEYLIDIQGPKLEQILGAGGLPPNEPIGGEEEVFARAVPAEDSQIPGDSAVTLYLLVSPDPDTDEGAIDAITVDYESDGTRYREDILVEHIVTSGDAC